MTGRGARPGRCQEALRKLRDGEEGEREAEVAQSPPHELAGRAGREQSKEHSCWSPAAGSASEAVRGRGESRLLARGREGARGDSSLLDSTTTAGQTQAAASPSSRRAGVLSLTAARAAVALGLASTDDPPPGASSSSPTRRPAPWPPRYDSRPDPDCSTAPYRRIQPGPAAPRPTRPRPRPPRRRPSRLRFELTMLIDGVKVRPSLSLCTLTGAGY